MSERIHPGAAEWLDLLHGRVDDAAARAMREHLRDGCARCEALRDWSERLLAAGEVELTDPPAAALSAARSLFDSTGRPSLADRVRTFAATLLSPPAPALAGAREAVSPDRPRTWEAGPYLIEVLVDPAPRRRRTTLRGRIVDRDTGLGVPGVARLLRDGRMRAETSLDDLGEAILREVVVTDGTLELLVEGGRIALDL